MLRFEWDHRKNQANRRKHGVTFEEAQTASLMRMQSNTMTQTIPIRKTVSYCWAGAFNSAFWWCVIATERATP